MKDKTFFLQVDNEVVRVRATKQPDEQTSAAIANMVRLAKTKVKKK
jgi:hypothetical protein